MNYKKSQHKTKRVLKTFYEITYNNIKEQMLSQTALNYIFILTDTIETCIFFKKLQQIKL